MGGPSWLRTGISGGILWKLRLLTGAIKGTFVPVITHHDIKEYGGVEV
jgi:hypothetical protein